LDDLGLPFEKEEIKKAIDDPPTNKAPGPDGFTIAFSELSVQNMHVINTASIVLLTKKDVADSITDFWPISLIHMVPKIIAKAMVLRLRPKMNDIISCCQSAFIKSRSIHDNFMYVRNVD
jgi:hypothetical protein